MNHYFPELDHYFLKYWWYNKDIYKANIIYPEIELKEKIIKSNSFFALLFDNIYSENNYVYTFSEISILDFSRQIRERIRVGGTTIKYYSSDIDSSLDYFGINGEIKNLLDILLEYRLTNTCNLNSINYENLEKNLSKMIYQYLDLMINNNTDYFDTVNVFCNPNNILETMFETYILNESHKKIKYLQFLSNSKDVILKPERFKIDIDENIVQNKKVTLLTEPYNDLDFFVFRNGDLLNRTSFDIINDTTSYSISWENKDTIFKKNDILVADYYIKVT